MKLITLQPKDYALASRFFDPSVPNYPVAMSVIDGHNPGAVWVDNASDPKVCVLIGGGGYSFVKGDLRSLSAKISDIVEVLKDQDPKVTCTHDYPVAALLRDAGFINRERILFRYEHDKLLIDKLCASLPEGLEVKPIDAELIKRSQWYKLLILFWGSEQAFLENSVGFMLMQGSQILSEAFACCTGGGFVETGSVTSEAHRRKGYATIVRAFLIKEILARGLTPISSCNADNMGSAKTSLKLGYVEDRRYLFMCLPARNA